MKYLLVVFACGTALSPAAINAAVLMGASVEQQYYFPTLSNEYSLTTYNSKIFTVGVGQDASSVIEDITTFNIDFDDLSLTILLDTTLGGPTFGPGDFNGLVFKSSAFTQLTGVSLSGSHNWAGFDTSRVTIVGDELRLNWNGLGYNTNSALGLNFTAAPAPVPEPSSWAMLLLGCGMVGGALRMSKRRQALRTSISYA